MLASGRFTRNTKKKRKVGPAYIPEQQHRGNAALNVPGMTPTMQAFMFGSGGGGGAAAAVAAAGAMGMGGHMLGAYGAVQQAQYAGMAMGGVHHQLLPGTHGHASVPTSVGGGAGGLVHSVYGAVAAAASAAAAHQSGHSGAPRYVAKGEGHAVLAS